MVARGVGGAPKRTVRAFRWMVHSLLGLMAIAVAANMRQNISLAKIALLPAYSYGYHGKSEKIREKEKKSCEKGKKARKSNRKGEESERKEKKAREKGKKAREKGRKALRPVFLAEDKAERLWFGAQGLNPLQPAYFDILALAFSTSSSLGRGSFLASITTWKTKSVTHFCEKPRRWLY